MTTSRMPTLVLGLGALVLAACDNRSLDPLANDGGAAGSTTGDTGGSTGVGGTTGTGGTGGTGGGSGTTGTGGSGGCIAARMSPASAAPAEHRSTATACSPSKAPPLDGGVLSCTSNADCVPDGGLDYWGYNTCLHGVCSFDQCLTDADCGSGVCGCSSDYYGGNAAYHPNICVPSNCHVDADCGAGGYCSPSRGRCGTFEGFYCHTAADTCVDATMDCTLCGNACVYAPTVGAFVCGGSVCGG
jgi:hypothetical protein